ncbi:hypothetical protein AL047_09055 [Pseudomonas syringae pv. broussonetiae]|nr:hypothetical protein AL047_09055 [Pseudomonas syringae pv. broussonetiae]
MLVSRVSDVRSNTQLLCCNFFNRARNSILADTGTWYVDPHIAFGLPDKHLSQNRLLNVIVLIGQL